MAQTSIGSGSPLAVKVTSAGGKKRRYAPDRPRNEKGNYTKRKYGIDTVQPEEEEAPTGQHIMPAYTDFKSLSDQALRALAVRNWNHRFEDDASRGVMLAELQRRTDLGRHARYV